MAGHEITLDGPATRIVALTAADCEILCALGAGDLLVGRGEYCDYPAEVMNISSVQSGSETNIEQIVALKPQVLLMSNMAQTEDQIAALENAGIKVVVSDVKDIEGVYTAITMIGKLAGREKEAVALIDQMKTTFSDIAAKVPAGGAKKDDILRSISARIWTLGSRKQHIYERDCPDARAYQYIHRCRHLG